MTIEAESPSIRSPLSERDDNNNNNITNKAELKPTPGRKERHVTFQSPLLPTPTNLCVRQFIQQQRAKYHGRKKPDNDDFREEEDEEANDENNPNGNNHSPNITHAFKSDNKFFFVNCENDQDDQTSPQTPSTPSLPVFHIGNFHDNIYLDFGDDRNNSIGKPRSLSFILKAPTSSKEDYHSLEIEKIPTKKGFHLEALLSKQEEVHDQSQPFYVKKGEEKVFTLTWTPVQTGKIREAIYLKMKRGRIRIIAHGSAKAMISIKKKKKRVKFAVGSKIKEATKNDTKPKRRPTPRATGSMSFLFESSPTNANLNNMPQQPWMTYNDAFAEKQCEAYKTWLNFVIKPHEDIMQQKSEMNDNVSDKGGVANASSQKLAATNDPSPTLKSLLVERNRVRSKQNAINFYNGEEMKSIRFILEDEILSDRLSMRSDHDVLANVNLRKQLTSLLMSYSVPWLKLVLETMFNETISLDSATECQRKDEQIRKKLGIASPNSKKPTMKLALKQFVNSRVLSDDEVLMKYTHGKCKMPSGKFERQYKKELCRNVLFRIFVIVIFLDKAKTNNLIDSAPRLFNKNGIIKSSKEFLAILCRDYMHGIGSIFKQLSLLGISVIHEQTCIDELDFSITNMATDLRDGVVLGKLADQLSGEHSILECMRLPAVSRLQKVHNVQIALESLASLDIIDLQLIQPNHIVDGHRPEVLRLLWSVISSFTLSSLLDAKKLKLEIYTILRCSKYQGDKREIMQTIEQLARHDDVCSLLLHWCKAICSCYDHDVDNFSSSFADGKTLSYLIHYYHPSMINLDKLLPTRADADDENLSEKEVKNYILNERKNCELVRQNILDVGGIPIMCSITDSHNNPDTRSTITCVSYLCARLLDSSREIVAATLIQKCYRMYRVSEKSIDNCTMKPSKNVSSEEDTNMKDIANSSSEQKQSKSSDFYDALKDLGTSAVGDAVNKSVTFVEPDDTHRNMITPYHKPSTQLPKVASSAKSIATACYMTPDSFSPTSSVVKSDKIMTPELSSPDDHSFFSPQSVPSPEFQSQQNMMIEKKPSPYKSSPHIQDLEASPTDKNVEDDKNTNSDDEKNQFRSLNEYITSPSEFESIDHDSILSLSITDVNYNDESLISADQDSTDIVIDKLAAENPATTVDTLDGSNEHSVESEVKLAADQTSSIAPTINNDIDPISQSEDNIMKMDKDESIEDDTEQLVASADLDTQDSPDIADIVIDKLGTVNQATTVDTLDRSNEHSIESEVKLAADQTSTIPIENKQAEYENIDFIVPTINNDIDPISQGEELLHLEDSSLDKDQKMETSQDSEVVSESVVVSQLQQTEFDHIEVKQSEEEDINACLIFSDEIVNISSPVTTKPISSETKSPQESDKLLNPCEIEEEEAICLVENNVPTERKMENEQFQLPENTPVRDLKAVEKANVMKKAVKSHTMVDSNILMADDKDCRSPIIELHNLERTSVSELPHDNILQRSSVTKSQEVKKDDSKKVNIKLDDNEVMEQLEEIKAMAAARKRIMDQKKSKSISNQDMTQLNEKDSVVISNSKIKSRFFNALREKRKQKRMMNASQGTKEIVEYRARKADIYCDDTREYSDRSNNELFSPITTKETVKELSSVEKRITFKESKSLMTESSKNHGSSLMNNDYDINDTVVIDEKLSEALHVLETSKNLTKIIGAARFIEESSRLQPNICEDLVLAKASRILYKLVRFCNRSSPHVELLQQLLMTLSNVSKTLSLMHGIVTQDCVEVLIDVLQLFRDKDNIFLLASTILRRIVYADQKMMETCQRRENMKRIKGIYSLTIDELKSSRSPKNSIARNKKLAVKSLVKIIDKIMN